MPLAKHNLKDIHLSFLPIYGKQRHTPKEKDLGELLEIRFRLLSIFFIYIYFWGALEYINITSSVPLTTTFREQRGVID